MSAYQILSDYSKVLNGNNIYIPFQRTDGTTFYDYNPVVVNEFKKAMDSIAEEYQTPDSYTPDQLRLARAFAINMLNDVDMDMNADDYLMGAFSDAAIGRGVGKKTKEDILSDDTVVLKEKDIVKAVSSVKIAQYRRYLIKKFFGSQQQLIKMNDKEVADKYYAMMHNLNSMAKLNSLTCEKLKEDKNYQYFNIQGKVRLQKQKEERKQKSREAFVKNAKKVAKSIKGALGSFFKTYFSFPEGDLFKIVNGEKPVSKEIQLANINALINAFENPVKVDENVQENNQTTNVRKANPTTPITSVTPESEVRDVFDDMEDTAEGPSFEYNPEGFPFFAPNVEVATGEKIDEDAAEKTDPIIKDESEDVADETADKEFVEKEPEPAPTTTIRKTVSYVKPIGLEELSEPTSFVGGEKYPTLTYADDSNEKKFKAEHKNYHHVGEVAVGKNPQGKAIIVSVYQKEGSNELFYGNQRIASKQVSSHKYINGHIEIGKKSGDIRLGKKHSVSFEYTIGEDGSISFVSTDLKADFEAGNLQRKEEQYLYEEVEIVKPLEGDVMETQENGAPVAIQETDDTFTPPAGTQTKELFVRSGDDIYGSVHRYEYYEDPNHKGTFFLKEDKTAERPITMVDQAELDTISDRATFHSDSYDQDFVFEINDGKFKNIDDVVYQEQIDAERARQDELTAQQAEELRIQREQAEIDRKKDYKHNGPDAGLYDMGDKKYSTFKHITKQDELSGYNKLSRIIPVGTHEVTLPDGTKQQMVVAVEVWQNPKDPSDFLIGDEVKTNYGTERFKTELDWSKGTSPVIDIANHEGATKTRPEVNVVIGRDAEGKLTIVSADFVADYESGQIKNKFSEKVSAPAGTEKETEKDVTSEMPDAYIYSRLHQDELFKFIGKKKGYDMMTEMEAFYESKGSPKQEVDSFRRTANNEAEVSKLIDYNKVAQKEFAKLKKTISFENEQEARLEYMLRYTRDMREANEKGKLDKFVKKYAKGQKTPPVIDSNPGVIVGGLNPENMGKVSIVAEQVIEDDLAKDIEERISTDPISSIGEKLRAMREKNAAQSAETSATDPVNTESSEELVDDAAKKDNITTDTTTDGVGEETATTVDMDMQYDSSGMDYEAVNRGWTQTNDGFTFTYGESSDPIKSEDDKNKDKDDVLEEDDTSVRVDTQTDPIVRTNPNPDIVITEPEPEKKDPSVPQTPVSTGPEELPSGIDDLAADCLWKDILDTVGKITREDGKPYIGSINLEILKIAAGNDSIKLSPKVEAKMKEIVLKSYENAHLREILESKGLSKLPEGKEGEALLNQAQEQAKQELQELGWDELSPRGRARLTLFELSKGKFNPNYGRELENGEIPDDHRRDSFFYRGLCKAGIDFDLDQYRQRIKQTLQGQLQKEDAYTRGDNVNLDENNIDPDKFTEVEIISEDGKSIKAHKITINGKEVYVSLDHKEILGVSDITSGKFTGKFGEISVESINNQIRLGRSNAPTKGMQGVTDEQKRDSRGQGSGHEEMGRDGR